MIFRLFKQDKSKAAEGSTETPSDDSGNTPVLVADAPIVVEPALHVGTPPRAIAPTDPDSLGFKTTAELEPDSAPMGQAKALEAIAFGAGMKGSGYHVLVTGPEGSGRRSATRAILQDIANKGARPTDWVYVSSFDPTGGYRALKLAPGAAKPFAEKMALAIDQLTESLPAAFAADDYDLKRRTIEEEFRFSREDALEALRREAEAQNIALLRTPAGIAVAPVLEGKVVKTDVFNSLPESLRREVETKIAALEAEIEAIMAERPDAEKERRARLLALNEQIAGRHVRAVLEDVRTEFADTAGVESYLKAATRDLVRNASLFLSPSGDTVAGPPRLAGAMARFARYGVHVMATSAASSTAPVVHEANPTYANLFGRVELGTGTDGNSQVVRIKPGALHRANGGYLLVDGNALLDSPGAAEALRRALEGEELRFDPPANPIGAVGDEVPDLEPIPLSVKLIVIGDEQTVRRLTSSGNGLRRLFKVEALFHDTVERSTESINAFARLIAGIVAKNSLRPFDAAGVGLLLDDAARRAGGNGKLSLRIADVVDVCREADHWADREGRDTATAADVEHALLERRSRPTTLAEAS
jgi:predicted ATP-dependent protease